MDFQCQLIDKPLYVCFTQEVASNSAWTIAIHLSTTRLTDSCYQRKKIAHLEPYVDSVIHVISTRETIS
jgi:hypothetical protein